jgi:hypothetical protein
MSANDRRLFSLGKVFLGVSLGVVVGLAGCHKTAAQSSNAVDQNGGDPADANMASPSASGGAPVQPAQVLGQSAQYTGQQQSEDYSQQQPPAPIERRAPDSGAQYPDQPQSGASYISDGTLTDAQAQDIYNSDLSGEQASDPPPPLPDYDQPPAPDPDYLWTPGYWAWGPGGYYWVPGVWVGAPYAGALWTPGYWGFFGGFYRFHHGYWGTHIGFYGGVDYGYGYVGHGYYGGYWNGGHFFYNSAVTRVNVNVIHNVYVHNVVINNVVVNNRIVNRVSYNGGRGGVAARPLPAEVAVLHEQRIPPMAAQVQVQHEAAQNKQQFYSENKGRPAVAVAARPVAADRQLPAPLPRTAQPATPQGFRPEARPGQPQVPAARPVPQQDLRPQQQSPQGRGQQEVPPARQGPEVRPAQPNRVEPQPQNRPTQPQQQVRPNEPRPQNRTSEPHGRPAQPQPQARPAQTQPQEKPAQSAAPPRPAPEARPAPQAAPRPEERPAPTPGPRPAPAPAPHPQPQPRPAPPPTKPAAREDEKPRSF